VCRLLEFIGCHDETVALAAEVVAPLMPPSADFRLQGT
jgi:hypothetical protein